MGVIAGRTGTVGLAGCTGGVASIFFGFILIKPKNIFALRYLKNRLLIGHTAS